MSNEQQVLSEAQQCWTRLKEQCETIAADKDMTVQARNRKIDELRADAESKLREFGQRHTQAGALDQQSALRAAVKPPANDPARMGSYRAALDRATAAQREQRLADVLEEAELIGDEDHATAAYTVALREGNSAVAEAFLADRPARRAAYDAFKATTKRNPMYDFASSAYFSLPHRPRVL